MIGRILCGVGRFFWGLTKVIIVLAVLTTIFFAVYLLRPHQPSAPTAGSLLDIHLVGRIADTVPATDGWVGVFQEADPVTLLSDVKDALAIAETDERIAGVLLHVEELTSIGGASARQIGEAIDRYKSTTGKRVWCYGYDFTQAQYAIATHADRLWLHPMGRIEVKGLSGEALYWGDFLKRLGVAAEVYKAGDFKSAPEIFERSEPTKDNLSAQRSYLSNAWHTMTESWAKGRGWEKDEWRNYIVALQRLDPMPNGVARFQKEYKLVDEVGDVADFDEAIRKHYHFGKGQFLLTDLYDYLDTNYPASSSGDSVAVLYAEGEMVNDSRLGRLVADELLERIDRVAADPTVRAIVLRLNSPGGDAMAAEKIRAALVNLRERGKPVVVSMGDAAASGGYWVATGGDVIFADPMTLTGSIGVFAVFPKLEGFRKEWSVGMGGYSSEPVLAENSLWQETSPVRRHELMSSVSFVYRTFKEHVAVARKMDLGKVEAISQGLVWTGSQAHELGLVDELGDLEAAVIRAKELAGLADTASVLLVPPASSGWWQAVLTSFPAAKVLWDGLHTAGAVYSGKMPRVQAWIPLPTL